MIHLNNISKQYGSQVLFSNSSFQILEGGRSGLVGPNGSGKTTILRIIADLENPDNGEINRQKNTIIGYFSQNVAEMSGRSALDEVIAVADDVVVLGKEIQSMEAAMGEPLSDDEMSALLEKYGEAVQSFEHKGGYDLETRAKTVLTGLGIGPDQYHRKVESFSGGWKMRIALGRILTLNPDVLLLDEPTNHLDVESIVWLEEWLSTEFKGALLMTSHDRDFMNRVVGRIVEVANQAITTYSGNYDFYLRERDVRKEQLLASYRRQREMMSKEEEFIARFAARASHAAQVQSRIKKLEKIDRIEIPKEEKTIRFEFEPPPRSGDEVVKFENLHKSWPHPSGGSQGVFKGVSGLIRYQEKVAVVGVNGAGKSTFLKVLAGKTEPSGGRVIQGSNVHVGYFSQNAMEVLRPDRTVFQTVEEALPLAGIGFLHNLLAAFLFRGDAVDKKIQSLSGGEKSRVVLATLLARPLNFLILDEPTNHLDIQSRGILLDVLGKFNGTLVLVSHDRHFLRSLVNRVLEIDRGEMRNYEGSYEYYLKKTQF